MEFELSFKPIIDDLGHFLPNQLGSKIMAYTKGDFPNLAEADLVIFCVPELRGDMAQNEEISFSLVRKELYSLFEGPERLRIADLGNLVLGERLADTYQLLTDVLIECEHRNLFSLVIGGGQDLTISQYNSCVKQSKISSFVSIDSRLDLGFEGLNHPSHSYLSEILNTKPNVLFNYSNIGYQSYLNPSSSIKLMDDLYFDIYRLGEIRHKMSEVEPILRNTDFISLDLNSIRLSESPANAHGSPNGFYAEEICQIMRYSGIGSKLKSLGIYHYDFKRDVESKTARLIAQLIWCFFDGFFHKMKQFQPTDADMTKFHVSMPDGEYNICFYKNTKTDKWWVEIPFAQTTEDSESCFIPCSYRDYQDAVKGNIPERWWKAFQKLN